MTHEFALDGTLVRNVIGRAARERSRTWARVGSGRRGLASTAFVAEATWSDDGLAVQIRPYEAAQSSIRWAIVVRSFGLTRG